MQNIEEKKPMTIFDINENNFSEQIGMNESNGKKLMELSMELYLNSL